MGAPPTGPSYAPTYSAEPNYDPGYGSWGYANPDPAPGPPPPPPHSVSPAGHVHHRRSAPPIQATLSGQSSHSHVSHHVHSERHVHQAAAPVPRPVHHHTHTLSDEMPNFQYSKCTGKRKAVCIGINYFRQQYELKGCVNDAKNVYRFLNRHHNYREDDIVLLVDDSRNPRQMPTRQNILEAMRWLVKDAQPHDALFFHYSGHGGQEKDRDGDEIDGWDEVIYPLDYQKSGSIVDDLMHSIMVKPLPIGCRLTALFDVRSHCTLDISATLTESLQSCHSGSVLDLPYEYHTNGRTKGSQVTRSHIKEKSTPADVISWSGCKDSQKSADTFEDGAAAGAMSHAFISSLTLDPNQTYQDLLRSVRDILKVKYSQKPQLSSSHRIDTNLKFIL
ncbi:hypothetical protein EUX98_g5580 [Antrodiella citrinella]|uniref:Peptidase C14 caspase domain-containing protein n=1 Tax=Antrodiella citrinella TaxID=2447956 RepID=A0A4S4MR30_9APHY|nr:hypothetical protein EUX98_g5580 [Antrodiella citrinella]